MRHGLGVARLQAFLEHERYSGGQNSTALMAKLRSAPRARVGELELAARRQLVLSFVATIRTLNAQLKDLERQIRAPPGRRRAGPIPPSSTGPIQVNRHDPMTWRVPGAPRCRHVGLGAISQAILRAS